jgi:hypothetical protein
MYHLLRKAADPLHLLDCSSGNEGGYALVVASAEVAKDCRKAPAWVLGAAEFVYTDSYNTIEAPWFPTDLKAVRRAADMAFSMAGVERTDMQVAELYDCLTITLLRDLEEMGFCKLGEVAAYVKDGHTRLGGSMPTDTDGGLLSHSATAAIPSACKSSSSYDSSEANVASGRSPMSRWVLHSRRVRRCTATPQRQSSVSAKAGRGAQAS